MQIQYSYRAIDKEFHEPWQRALGNVMSTPSSHCSTNTLKIQRDFKSSLIATRSSGNFWPVAICTCPAKRLSALLHHMTS